MGGIKLSNVESKVEGEVKRKGRRVKRPYKKLLHLSEDEMKAIKVIANAYNVDAANAIRIAIAELARKLQAQNQQAS
jgi:hypothetical protein